MTFLLSILVLLGCRPDPSCDAPAVEALETPVFAGVMSDFNAGQVVLGDADGVTSAAVLSVSGDALVRVARMDGESQLYVVERGGREVLTRIDLADPGTPVWQVSLPDDANVHDLVGFADQLWLTSYGRGEVLVVDPATGEQVDTLDLSAFADPDGNPELDRALVLDGLLVVAAQRLFEDPELGASVLTSIDGRLIALDEAGEVVDTWETGPNPRLAMGASEALVATGLFVVPNAEEARATDGVLRPFTLADGLGPVLAEEDGVDLYTVVDGTDVVLTVDADARSEVRCLGGGQWTGHDGWLIDGTVLPDGSVALAGRRGPQGDWPSGVVRFDPLACAPLDATPTCSVLPPYDLTPL